MIAKSLKEIVDDLCAKDEQKASVAAHLIVDSADLEMFRLLVKKSEYLFDFVKNNVSKRLKKAVNETNYKNLLTFFDCYSADFEDCIVSSLAKYADEDLTDKILEMLETGNNSQKAYCAKYFFYIQDTLAIELLQKYAFDEFEPLAINCAQTLGAMKNKFSYQAAINLLKDKNEDDFEKIKAIRFLVSYNDKTCLQVLFEAMHNSPMPENIAGEIPYLESLMNLMATDFKSDAIDCFEYIISGLPEILPLSQIFTYEILDILEFLMNSEKNSRNAVILLKSLLKFEMITENNEYTFDEDKSTKQELKNIYELLTSKNEQFWQEQKTLLLEELKLGGKNLNSAIEVVKELKYQGAFSKLRELLKGGDDLITSQAIEAIKELGKLNEIDVNSLHIKNENIKAIVESYFTAQ